jgi:O-antigen/teichoic acid export membrane protein
MKAQPSGNSPASLKRNSLWMLAGQAAKLLLQGLYFVLIGRALGSRQYGAFIGVAAMIAILAQFATWGSGMMMLRSVSRDRAMFPRAWGNALLMTGCLSVVVLVLVFAFAHLFFSAQLLVIVPFVAFADTLCAKLVDLSSQAFQAFHRLRDTAQITALTSAIRLMAAAWLFVGHRHAAGNAFAPALAWAKLYLAASIAAAVVAAALVTFRLGLPKFGRISRQYWTEGLGFSVAYSTTSIYNDIDKAMLASLGQLRAAGIYGTAYRIIDIACIPITAVHAAAMPQFFSRGHEGPMAMRGFVRRLLSRTSLYAIAAAVILASGAGLVPLLMGPSYAGSVSAIRWLCLLPLLRSFHLAAGDCITATSSQWWRTASQLLAALFNLLLNFLLIPKWSWQGAALASLLTDGGLAFTNWLILKRLSSASANGRATVAIIPISESFVTE